MQVISIVASKGGAGKSTLAAHLSVLAERERGPVLAIDADEQGSLSFWYQLRDAPEPIVVPVINKPRLDEILSKARADGCELVIIDGPPHSAGWQGELIKASHLCLIPCRPSLYDLKTVPTMIETVNQLKRPHMAVLSAAPPRIGSFDNSTVSEARRALKSMDAVLWDGQITQRAAYQHALASGVSVNEFEPDGKASVEIKKLWETVSSILDQAIGDKQ